MDVFNIILVGGDGREIVCEYGYIGNKIREISSFNLK